MAEREELLTQSLGAGDPATVECRRIRILWKMDLGAGAGPARPPTYPAPEGALLPPAASPAEAPPPFLASG